MSQKVVALVWICLWVFLAGVIGGGAWYFHEAKQDQSKKTLGSTSQANSTNQAIPLTSFPSTSSSNNGLSVDTNSEAARLGQFGNNQGQSVSPSNSKNNSSSTIDPANFAEYEKYKDNTSTLFGEVQVGTGSEATANHKVAVYYKGWLTNGQLFDQSQTDKDGKLQPFVFTLGAHQVIPGWEQGLLGMKVGGSRLLIIPPGLGYGAEGHGPVPPNAVMVFLVQLVAVE